jgi:hypothetical protein
VLCAIASHIVLFARTDREVLVKSELLCVWPAGQQAAVEAGQGQLGAGRRAWAGQLGAAGAAGAGGGGAVGGGGAGAAVGGAVSHGAAAGGAAAGGIAHGRRAARISTNTANTPANGAINLIAPGCAYIAAGPSLAPQPPRLCRPTPSKANGIAPLPQRRRRSRPRRSELAPSYNTKQTAPLMAADRHHSTWHVLPAGCTA